MTQYDNTNRGAFFKELEKKSDKHPDYKGTLNVGGVDYWLSGWIKESQAGKKFMSLSVEAKQAPSAAPAPAPARSAPPPRQAPPAGDWGDDDVPF